MDRKLSPLGFGRSQSRRGAHFPLTATSSPGRVDDLSHRGTIDYSTYECNKLTHFDAAVSLTMRPRCFRPWLSISGLRNALRIQSHRRIFFPL